MLHSVSFICLLLKFLDRLNIVQVHMKLSDAHQPKRPYKGRMTKPSHPELDDRVVPDALKAAFRDAVVAFDAWRRGQPEPWVQIGRRSAPVSSIFMALRFSAEPVPRDLREVVRGRTIADACRRLLSLMP